MKKFYSLLLFVFPFLFMQAQNGIVSGIVKDKKTHEPIPGVNIIMDDKSGTSTDLNGFFTFKSNSNGKQTISFQYVGYKPFKQVIFIKPNEEVKLTVFLEEDVQMIDEVVVSASKFEQRISEVTVSMEVIKPKLLENNNVSSMDAAINRIPGVDIIGDQPSIRGGSGYSYGAGSRVLLLVDDMPLISPDAGDIKWNYLPIENVSQVEVIKGAASALFGSSALNGVINVRTAYPKSEPETKVTIFNGMYMNPKRKELKWWGQTQPLFVGSNIFHMQRLKNWDVVIGAHGFSDNGYRQYETEERLRGNFNIRYRFPNQQKRFFGINGNFMTMDKTEFFLWKNADSGAWRQDLSTTTRNIGTRINIDPYFTFYTSEQNKHSIKTRYFYVKNNLPSDTAKNSHSSQYYSEYQFQRQIKEDFAMTLGFLHTYSDIKGKLFDKHDATNISLFGQFDKKLLKKKLNLSAGIRAEYFRIDSKETKTVIAGDTIKDIPIQPVLRIGANYQLFEYTFIRTSFGQGYRFPTIAEKYTFTNVGALNIFPNPYLKPETGWSGEIGIKQGVKISNWNGYLDISAFWQEYTKMMEYTFGFYHPQTFRPLHLNDPADLAIIGQYGYQVLGFQSQNVGSAQIKGFDITFTGKGSFFNIPATLLAGYTYTEPRDMNLKDSSKSTDSNILKYRYFHSIKADFQLDFKKISTGISVIYLSRIINIDKAFEDLFGDGPGVGIELLPGLYEYRQKNNKGSMVFDYRISWNINETSKLSLVVKNLLNAEYMGRPGDIRPPRNISLQYILSI
ncbi:MAG: TonB-dependent receptor [Bacteroidales bacterium]|nr:TonB-dependent receptor [Bacteroidales bacterium]